MDAQTIVFAILALVSLFSGIMVVTRKNPVYSILFLVLTFFCYAGFYVLLGATFLAAIQIMVYAGAIMVLFLFVVMMLDIDFVRMRQGFLQYVPLGGMIGLILLIELLVVLGGWVFTPEVAKTAAAPMPAPLMVRSSVVLPQPARTIASARITKTCRAMRSS